MAAGLNGVGAVLVFNRDEQNHGRLSGLAIVFASWVFIALTADADSLAAASFVATTWFTFESKEEYSRGIISRIPLGKEGE
ncbi:hypothetical protein [Halobacterium noricense]|uniref:hypothetical protein n=1 Tax=Halobacterium noricense TaxID=223182 RepID=UPI001E40E6C6|nr:hypothetical protein [Halobacterium noricense]UHH27220.1 hypothetical protein LT974_16390 [Halobacterium noricense]